MRRLALLSLAALSGCILLVTDELEVLPAGPIFAGDSLSIELACPCTRVRLELGREPLGDVAANRVVTLAVPRSVADGTHLLRATALDADTPTSAARDVTVLHGTPAIVSVEPPAGDLAARAAFRIEVRFSHPLLPERSGKPYVVATAGGSLPAPRLSDDRRGLVLDVPAGLDTLGAVELSVDRNAFGPPRTEPPWRFAWTLPPKPRLTLAVDAPAAAVTVADEVELRFRAISPTTARSATIHVEARRDGSGPAFPLGSLPWTPNADLTLTWDTRAVPDGTYTVTLSATSMDELVFSPPAVPPITVDRTPPGLTGCHLVLPTYNPRWVNSCVALDVDGPFTIAADPAPTMTLGGRPRAVSISYLGQLCPEPMDPVDPFALSPDEVVAGVLLDPQGNRTPFTCHVTLPIWVAPFGEGPLAGVTAAPGGLGVWGGYAASGVIVTPAGRVDQVYGLAPDPWVLTGPKNERPGGIATEASGGFWIEHATGGPGQVMPMLREPYVTPRPLNLDPTRDAAALVRAVSYKAYFPQDLRGSAVSWTELGTDGLRRIVWYTYDDYTRAGPSADPGASVHEHAFVKNAPGLGEDGDPFVGVKFFAWTEAQPAGVRQLRGAWFPAFAPDWERLPTIANADPSADAFEPSVWDWDGEGAVAWREGGTVYARVSAGTTFGPAAALNADPERAARRPVLDRSLSHPRVYFLEAVDGGDAIRMREWTGTEWRLMSAPVNVGAIGPVTDLVAEGGWIFWRDPDGGVRVRTTDGF